MECAVGAYVIVSRRRGNPGGGDLLRLLRKATRNDEEERFVLRQLRYPGGRFLMQAKLYSGFCEQVPEGIIGVAAEGDEAFYPGIDQHLGAEYTW
jgi:hypothetical protein